jgi:hypothetical protein
MLWLRLTEAPCKSTWESDGADPGRNPPGARAGTARPGTSPPCRWSGRPTHVLRRPLDRARWSPTPRTWIFTPATKADLGEHDENVAYDAVVATVGAETADRLRKLTLEIYAQAEQKAEQRGIILADTKFEFGARADGTIVLGDEVLTPDSSRFWPADQWQPGKQQPSYDKQIVRDWLQY